jgi:hypothetical protein
VTWLPLYLSLDDSDEALITSLYPPISADQGHSKPRDINPLMFGGGVGGKTHTQNSRPSPRQEGD